MARPRRSASHHLHSGGQHPAARLLQRSGIARPQQRVHQDVFGFQRGVGFEFAAPVAFFVLNGEKITDAPRPCRGDVGSSCRRFSQNASRGSTRNSHSEHSAEFVRLLSPDTPIGSTKLQPDGLLAAHSHRASPINQLTNALTGCASWPPRSPAETQSAHSRASLLLPEHC